MTTDQRKAAFHDWLSEHIGDLATAPTLFLGQITDQAAEIFAPERFSKKITRGSLADGEFAGGTFEAKRDERRLRGQLLAVFELMQDGEWRTLPEIAAKVNASGASVSARLRDLRKPEFGGHTVERQRVKGGLFRYRLLVSLPVAV